MPGFARSSLFRTTLFTTLLAGSLAACDDTPSPAGSPGLPSPEAPTDSVEPRRDTRFLRAHPRAGLPTIGGALWRSVGPHGIRDGQTENVAPDNRVSGAVHAVVPHPRDPDRLWIATTNGGIWETRNARAADPTWKPLTDQLPSLSIGALDLDPTDSRSRTLAAGIGNVSSYGESGLLDGILLTKNGGLDWRRITDPLLVGHSISGIAARGDVLVASATSYYGTFEPGGVMRSVDGGATWAQVAEIPAVDVYDLVGDPADPARLFAIAAGGVYRSDDTGATWRDVSSADPRLSAVLADPGLSNAELDVGPGGRLFAAVTRYGLLEYLGYSDGEGDIDSGASGWIAMDLPFTPESGFQSVAAAVPDSYGVLITSPGHGLVTGLQVEVRDLAGLNGGNGVYIVVTIDEDRFYLYEAQATGAYTGGGTWRLVTGMNPKAKSNGSAPSPFGGIRRPGGQGSIHLSIAADPLDRDVVYVGGDRQDLNFWGEVLNYLGAENYSGRLFRGDASVATTGLVPSPQWQHLTHRNDIADIPGGGTASTSAPHADSRELAFDAAGGLIEGDDGGIYRRTSPRDASGDWISMVGNLGNTELHNVAYDRVSKTVIGGAQDVGTPMQSAGSTIWSDYTQGDGGDVAVDDVTLATAGQSVRYSAYPNYPIASRSIWDATGNFVSEVTPEMRPLDGVQVIGSFTTPVELNVIDPRRLVIGGSNGVFESADQGDTTTMVGSGMPRFQNAMAYGGRLRNAENPDVLYYGAASTVLVRTAPGVAAAPTSTPFPGGEVRDIALAPRDWRAAYVIDPDHVYVTTDAGATWLDITGNLTDASLRSVVVVRALPFLDYVLVGGLTGVSVTPVLFGWPVAGATWFELGTNLPNAPVWDLDWDASDRVLTVGSLGRGAWQTNLPAAPLPAARR
ncbi:MAG TPA: hypothetical protein VM261_28930 [Kofleriaceae bacterium]|nr:hypothetical protein [Kofleriaceae bacterium]